MKHTIATAILFACAGCLFAQRASVRDLGRDDLVVTNEVDAASSAALSLHAASTNLHLTSSARAKIAAAIDAASATGIASSVASGLTAPLSARIDATTGSVASVAAHTNDAALHLSDGERNKIAASVGSETVTNVALGLVWQYFTNEASYRRAGDAASTNYARAFFTNLSERLSEETGSTARVSASVDAHTNNGNLHLTALQRAKINSVVAASVITGIASAVSAPLSDTLGSATGTIAQISSDLAAHTNAGALHLAAGERTRIAAAVTNEQDAAALSALAAYAATNRTTAIYGTNGWTDGDGSVWRIETVAGSEPVGMRMTFSPGSSGPEGPLPQLEFSAAGDASALTFIGAAWTAGITTYTTDIDAYYCAGVAGGEWNSFEFVWPQQPNFPVLFLPSAGSSGTGTLSIVYASSIVTARVDSVVYESAFNLHRDSFTNLVWRDVWSNGWHWLVAHTNVSN